MKFNFKPSTSAVMCAVAVVCSAVLLTACGGGGGSSADAGTTPVAFAVIDGPIKGAQVFVDKNGNGVWDAGEVKGTTDAAGNVTLDVPKADAGKYPIVAIVGEGAIDADTGVPLTAAQAYTLKAPADHSGVVSPLTTLVQHAVESDPTKATTTAAAIQSLKDQTGIADPMANFVAAATADPLARTVAKTVVSVKQSMTANLASAVGATDPVSSTANAKITQADIDALIRAEILKLLPAIVAAVQTQTQSGGSCTTGMSAACQTAITTAVGTQAAGGAAATGLVAQTTTTPANVVVTAGVVKAGKTPDTATGTGTATVAAEASVSLDDFRWSDVSNWAYRIFYATAAQNNTVDANGMTKNQERRVKNVAGTQTTWTYNFDSARDGDLHWDGAAWKNCADSGGISAKNPDGAGLYAYSYCGGFSVGKQSRTSVDISGKKFGEVVDQIQAVNTLWGTAAPWQLTQTNPQKDQSIFPAGSTLRFQTAVNSASAIAYDPRPAITGSNYAEVKIYSTALNAGGDARTDQTHICRGSEYATSPAISATTLESLLNYKGVPCKFNQFTVTNPTAGGAAAIGGKDATPTTAPTYSESWDNSTLDIGSIGQANNMATFGAYTTTTRIRVAFGTGNAVTYYACRLRWNNSGTRECNSIGNGTYAISTLGDARVMTFSGLSQSATTSLGYNYGSSSCTSNCAIMSAPASGLTYDRVFVERGGKVYYGFKNKLATSNSARLNLTATNAIFNAVGIPAIVVPSGASQ
jgi:trimeric autotransporter adhesin